MKPVQAVVTLASVFLIAAMVAQVDIIIAILRSTALAVVLVSAIVFCLGVENE